MLATKSDDLNVILGTRGRTERMYSRELSSDRHLVWWMVVTTHRDTNAHTHERNVIIEKTRNSWMQRSASLEEEEGVWGLRTMGRD